MKTAFNSRCSTTWSTYVVEPSHCCSDDIYRSGRFRLHTLRACVREQRNPCSCPSHARYDFPLIIGDGGSVRRTDAAAVLRSSVLATYPKILGYLGFRLAIARTVDAKWAPRGVGRSVAGALICMVQAILRHVPAVLIMTRVGPLKKLKVRCGEHCTRLAERTCLNCEF